MFGSGLLRDRRDMLRACHRVKHEDGHNSSLSNIEMDKPQVPGAGVPPPPPPSVTESPQEPRVSNLSSRPTTLGKWGFASFTRD